MKIDFQIGGRTFGQGRTLIIAELSANHNGDFERAVKIVEEAAAAGADAIKVQTYTADSMTIPCQEGEFKIEGTIWDGQSLYDLYAAAAMPWDWQPKLAKRCSELGLLFFSSPFDNVAIDFLEDLGVPGYKIASFELVDIPLIQRAASTGKPLIMSTGMATLGEISEAVEAARETGCSDIALLKCTSAYPADPKDANLKTIPHLAETYGVVAGLSDHTLGISVPVASIALGGVVVEKHLTLSRSDGGPDSEFSLEPGEFKEMVECIRAVESAIGTISYPTSDSKEGNRKYRRSLYVVEDMKKGEAFNPANLRSIRPGLGLPPKYYESLLGRKVNADVPKGTAVNWDIVL